MRKRTIAIELDPVVAAAFDMLLADLNNADPGARWTPEALARSMLEQIIEDDFILNQEAVQTLN